MKTILSVMFAMMVGLTFVGSTFADEKKMDAPAGAPSGAVGTDKGDTTKKAADGKAADKDKKKKDKDSGDKEKH